MPTARKAVVSDETIRVHAYHLWERDGRPQGRDEEYWHRAAEELGALRTVAAAKAKTAAKTAAKSATTPRSATAPKAKPVKVRAVKPAKPAVAVKG